jgi:hypothetical protein
VWMEYCSSVVDRRVVKSCVVLCNLCVRKVYVRYEVIFGRVRIVVIDVFKAIFLSFKLVKQPFESDKNLLDSAIATSSAASFKQRVASANRPSRVMYLLIVAQSFAVRPPSRMNNRGGCSGSCSRFLRRLVGAVATLCS